MAFRRSRGRFGRRKRRTYWVEGNPLRFTDAYAGDLIRDSAGTAMGRSHVVELVGAIDLPDVGGEGAVVKRILGHCKPLVHVAVDPVTGTLLGDRAYIIMQSIVLLTRPEGTITAQTNTSLLAPWLMSTLTAGLGSEDLLHTRFMYQPAPYDNINYFTSLEYMTFNDGGAVQAQQRPEFWAADKEYDYDVTVSRKLDEDKTLFLVTQWQRRFSATFSEQADATHIAYEGYFRGLVMKGL